MTTLSYTVPVAGSTLNSVADPEIQTALNTILTWSTQIDSSNITNVFGQSVGSNTGTQTVKGAVNISTSQNTSSTTYTTLATPDQVTGIVLPANGLIRVWYQATWQESVSGAARAAVFIGANQLKSAGNGGPVTQAAATNGATANTAITLFSCGPGLVSGTGGTYTGDVTTGQMVGGSAQTAGEWGGFVEVMYAGSSWGPAAGSIEVFAAAATYTVSVQFKASSGTVTASNRKLWVQALSFA